MFSTSSAASSPAATTSASVPPTTSQATAESSFSITTSSNGMSTSAPSTMSPSKSVSSSPPTPSSTSLTTTSSSSSTTTPTTSTTSSQTTSTASSTTSSTTTSTDPSTSPSTTITTTTTTTPSSIIFTTTSTRTLPVTTLQSTVFITTTNDRGFITTTALSSFTSVLTTTASNGSVITVTEIQVNPTLNSNNRAESATSQFFANSGAVAGTFILVGLAATSLLMWMIFFVRRRRRIRRMEHDSAVSATLAAAGLYRTPLDDDEDEDQSKGRHRISPEVEMNERGSSRIGMQSLPSNSRMSAYFDAAEPDSSGPFNPYTEFGAPSGNTDGYVPARASSPEEHYRDRQGSTSTAGFVMGHSKTGSYEPLLASYHRQSAASPPSPTVPLAPLAKNAEQNKEEVQPRESERLSAGDLEDTDKRLDPNIRQRLESGGDNVSARELRDEEDYSRPVLLVRNLPDASSHES